MDKLTLHRDAYRQALQQQDAACMDSEKRWLTAATAEALMEQDMIAINALRAHLAELIAPADRFDLTGKPGDRWRTLTDLLYVAAESALPLEQLRLAAPGKLSGLILKQVQKQPGITSGELAERCQKEPNHIANELKKLDRAGLIHKQRRGRNQHVYLSTEGKAALDTLAPVQLAPPQPVAIQARHVDPQRAAILEQYGPSNILQKAMLDPTAKAAYA
jgi:DNA-binding MarR family transcriptional regulator